MNDLNPQRRVADTAALSRMGQPPWLSKATRPIWLQIADRLGSACGDGTLASGTRLPGEIELASIFGVSRVTIRRALAKLQQEGQLQARRGVGIFVRAKAARYSVESSRRFADNLCAQGREIQTRTLSLSRVEATPQIAVQLGLKTGDLVIRLVRLRLLDDEPVYLAEKHLPDLRFDRFETIYEMRQSLSETYAAHGIARFERTETRVAGCFAKQWEAQALKLTDHTPLLSLEYVNCDGDGVPIEHNRGLWPLVSVELVFPID